MAHLYHHIQRENSRRSDNFGDDFPTHEKIDNQDHENDDEVPLNPHKKSMSSVTTDTSKENRVRTGKFSESQSAGPDVGTTQLRRPSSNLDTRGTTQISSDIQPKETEQEIQEPRGKLMLTLDGQLRELQRDLEQQAKQQKAYQDELDKLKLAKQKRDSFTGSSRRGRRLSSLYLDERTVISTTFTSDETGGPVSFSSKRKISQTGTIHSSSTNRQFGDELDDQDIKLHDLLAPRVSQAITIPQSSSSSVVGQGGGRPSNATSSSVPLSSSNSPPRYQRVQKHNAGSLAFTRIRSRRRLSQKSGTVLNENGEVEQPAAERPAVHFVVGTIIFLFVCVVVVIIPVVLLARRPSSLGGIPQEGNVAPPPSSAPTSNAFFVVAQRLGFNASDDIFADPNNCIFRSVDWLAYQDQFLDANITTTMPLQNNQQERLEQRFAALALYFATEGESWLRQLNFLNATTSECNWNAFSENSAINADGDNANGIMCADGLRVDTISLVANNVGGSIPSVIGLLSSLQALEIRDNNLNSTIPSEIFGLPKLEVVLLSQNQLSGPIPSQVVDQISLMTLGIQSNQMTGSIPTQIGRLTNLEILALNANQLSGSIPSSMASMTNLKMLSLSNNNLTSSLPPELGALSKLTVYTVSFNSLSGTLPFETDSNPVLISFEAESNQLSGPIAPLTRLPLLSLVDLSDNNFGGRIPLSLCNTAIERFQANNNQLIGSLPSCLPGRPLRALALANNALTGLIPRFQPTIEILSLENNQLGGAIPIGPYPELQLLTLQSNPNFRGTTIPPLLGQMTRLSTLDLGDCGLVGSLPSELGLLTSLRFLSLVSNNLRGTIPASFVNLAPTLTSLQLAANQLTGSLELFCDAVPPTAAISMFNADCLEEITCSCCNVCCNSANRCRVVP